jgi:hypothetical protein
MTSQTTYNVFNKIANPATTLDDLKNIRANAAAAKREDVIAAATQELNRRMLTAQRPLASRYQELAELLQNVLDELARQGIPLDENLNKSTVKTGGAQRQGSQREESAYRWIYISYKATDRRDKTLKRVLLGIIQDTETSDPEVIFSINDFSKPNEVTYEDTFSIQQFDHAAVLFITEVKAMIAYH